MNRRVQARRLVISFCVLIILVLVGGYFSFVLIQRHPIATEELVGTWVDSDSGSRVVFLSDGKAKVEDVVVWSHADDGELVGTPTSAKTASWRVRNDHAPVVIVRFPRGADDSPTVTMFARRNLLGVLGLEVIASVDEPGGEQRFVKQG